MALERPTPDPLAFGAAALCSLGAAIGAGIALSRSLRSYATPGAEPSALLVEGAAMVARLARLRISVDGAEHVAALGSRVLVVANHSSILDVVAIVTALGHGLPQPLRVVAKAELFRIPGVAGLSTVRIDRGDQLLALHQLTGAIRELQAGGTLLVFPEGTRSPTGCLLQFKSGVFRAAATADAIEVLPVALAGAFDALPPGALLFKNTRLHLSVGAPFPATARHTQLKKRAQADVAGLLEHARRRIEEG